MIRRTALRPRHQNAPRPAWKVAEAFKQWLRGRECYLADKGGCAGKIEAAHVDHAGGKGISTKVADRHCLPLCQAHHREQHNKGWRTFEIRYGFNAVDVAGDYWHLWPGRVAWERKQGDAA